MEVRLEIPFGIAPKTMNPILPSEVIPLPVHLAETGRISWRPSNKDYLWSEAQPLSKVDVDELSLGVTATVCLLSISAQPRSIPLLRQCGGDGSVGCNICFKVFVRQASSNLRDGRCGTFCFRLRLLYELSSMCHGRDRRKGCWSECSYVHPEGRFWLLLRGGRRA
ncbi:uncharacterized protein LOC112344670 [Selaginella moellendorffii]|uniref:uncharacterized protein LOC112344670 n=1 Tax=Selaginella moellendorffii TaxID=88036 RepID=UPI000D1C4C0C|nr:uncharacterized protein LOC112344670 [Selaginella moellendorffii]|eukprot:XP_024525669.1 uncharacterized protein LOC112344670 [Selaginella moellendorffii]